MGEAARNATWQKPKRISKPGAWTAHGLTTTAMNDRPAKRSLTLSGHRTSVSIEEPFWQEFRRLAAARGISVNQLAAELDRNRTPPASLASAMRLYVLQEIKAGR